MRQNSAAMESHEVLREAVDRVGVKVLAQELKLSPSLVYKWCLPPETDVQDGSGARNPLDRLAEIVRVTRDTGVIHWMCQLGGGFFVPNPMAGGTGNVQALKCTQEIIREFSELLTEVSRSLEHDQSITSEEAQRIRREWEQLKTLTEQFVVACESGVYQAPPTPK